MSRQGNIKMNKIYTKEQMYEKIAKDEHCRWMNCSICPFDSCHGFGDFENVLKRSKKYVKIKAILND